LLGSLVGLGLLNLHHELTAMGAAGLRPTAIGRASVAATLVLLFVQFACAAWLGPTGQQWALREERALVQSGLEGDAAYWTRKGRMIVRIGSLRLGRLPNDIEVFELSADNHLGRYIHAQEASIRNGGNWLLKDVVIKEFSDGNRSHGRMDQLHWPSLLDAQELARLQLPAESLTLGQLMAYAEQLQRADRDSGQYRLILWRQPAVLVLTLAMSLMALPFAIRATPRAGLAPPLVTGALVGIGVYMADQVLLRTADTAGWAPVASAFAGPGAAVVVACVWLAHTHRR